MKKRFVVLGLVLAGVCAYVLLTAERTPGRMHYDRHGRPRVEVKRACPTCAQADSNRIFKMKFW